MVPAACLILVLARTLALMTSIRLDLCFDSGKKTR
uniref:Uncharacterized protein n=1 Tax=Arundo donax TaxID=35708 RepID=A0A0A8XS71_ARUDO